MPNARYCISARYECTIWLLILKRERFMLTAIRRYLLSGLLLWLPIWVTYLVVRFLIDMMDNTLDMLPKGYQPDHLLGLHIPGIGLIFTLIVLFFTGMAVTNFLGKHLVAYGERIINSIPVVRSIYTGVKKVLETLFSPQGKAFRKVLLVEYPRKGLWSVAFQTGRGCSEAANKLNSELVTIFIPTTPNPTSGFLMMLPKAEIHELDMSVEEALKLIISLGVVQPE
jgi:uncharacterized membrane protein